MVHRVGLKVLERVIVPTLVGAHSILPVADTFLPELGMRLHGLRSSTKVVLRLTHLLLYGRGVVIDAAIVGDHGLSVVIFYQLLVTRHIVIALHEHPGWLIPPSNQDLLWNARVQFPLVLLQFPRSGNLGD